MKSEYARGWSDATAAAVSHLFAQADSMRDGPFAKPEWVEAIQCMAGHLARNMHVPIDAGLAELQRKEVG
jgi:hypothetical protein